MTQVDDGSMTRSARDLRRWSALAGSEESDDLVRSARAHFASTQPRAAFRAALLEPGLASDHARWADAGYLDIGLPEGHGGVGDLVDLARVLDVAASELVGDGLLATSAARQVQLELGAVAAGRGALALGEGRATGGRLESELLVVDGRDADRITVIVRERDVAHVALVDPRSPGVDRRAVARDHDPTRPAVRVRLDHVEPVRLISLSPEEVAAPLARARVCVAADLVGTAAAGLSLALDHVATREQFDRPLGAFQAVKHQLADAYVDVETARSLVLGAAVEHASDDGHRLSLLALAAAGDAARRTSALAVQLLGAMGVTFEADAHLVLRRAQQTVLLLESTRAAYAAAARLTRGADRA